ncbi:hypothetical protein PTI98_002288 [Pleurotus ostreatus]|nr:hypothetical protein PTI98_002288 [Pleurotus ostreatus]
MDGCRDVTTIANFENRMFSGIWSPFGILCAGAGDKVIATARSLGKIEDLPENTLVKDKAENLRLLALDVTAGFTAIKEVIDKANTFWGRIDVLVNNAGYGVPAILEEGGK